MRKLLRILTILMVLSSTNAFSQKEISGVIYDAVNKSPLAGATVRSQKTGTMGHSDGEGRFSINSTGSGDTLFVSFVGYKTAKIGVSDAVPFLVYLEEENIGLDDVVVSTGYYSVLRDNSTGSFEHLNSELLNRAISSDLLSRLEGITPGLHFDKRGSGSRDFNDGDYSLRLRGISTIYADSQPLIVLDNYPFEGDLRSINPNTVKSVTVLRDAAAASIWGAKAANGVIVITTKSGIYEKPMEVSFTSNVTVSSRPDLSYMSSFIDSRSFIDLEKSLFSRGFYTSRENNLNKPVLSPVVEALISHRDGAVSQQELDGYLEGMASRDLLGQASTYLYQRAVNQQYALNMSGGSQKANYMISGGYDNNTFWSKGNAYERLSMNIVNQFKPFKFLDINTNVTLIDSEDQKNAVDLRSQAWAFPYLNLVDENGASQPFPRDYRPAFIDQAENEGILDWHYAPLDELRLNNHRTRAFDTRIITSLKYHFSDKLNVDIGYQYHRSMTKDRNLRNKDSYFVRNLVNRFTQSDGRRVFPYGDILTFAGSELSNQTLRAQVNYVETVGKGSSLNALGGMEVRESRNSGEGSSFYGYNDEVLTIRPSLDYSTLYPVRPISMSLIPTPDYSLFSRLNRYLSYYGNVSLNMRSKYVLSSSIRWDASNLFGVKTNQKGVPLWSAGGNWKLSSEKFYRLKMLPSLNLRLTYGYGGNIDNSSTAFTTILYRSQVNTNLPFADVNSPGNRHLRWEKVSTLNLGIDFGLKAKWLSGYLELYHKHSTDLMGLMLVDPTIYTGSNNRSSVRINYADMTTKGIDVSLNAIKGGRTMKLNSNLFVSYTANKVNAYKGGDISTSIAGYTRGMTNLPVEGNSIDALYSLPWAGLDPANGDPLVVTEGNIHKNYTQYLNSLQLSQLINHGSSVPLIFSSFRNGIIYKGLSVSVNITYKGLYYFRRPTIMYGTLVSSNEGMHRDYYHRWQKPGDELMTSVPSIPAANVANRDLVFSQSEALVSKGDHIRWNDINLSYTFNRNPSLTVYSYISNLGILWKAAKGNIDPDYPSSTILPPKNYSLGLKLNF